MSRPEAVREILSVLDELHAYEAEERERTGTAKGDIEEGAADTFIQELLNTYFDAWPDDAQRRFVETLATVAPECELTDMLAIARERRSWIPDYRAGLRGQRAIVAAGGAS